MNLAIPREEREYDRGGNGDGHDHYVTRAEFHQVTNTILQQIGRVAGDVGRSAARVDELISDVRTLTGTVRDVKKTAREKLASIPGQVAAAVEGAEETTLIRNLRRENVQLKGETKARARWYWAVAAAVASSLMTAATIAAVARLFH